MRTTFLLALLVAAFAFSPNAKADITFDFDSSQPDFSFPFSQNDGLDIGISFDGGGNNGTEGLQVDVNSVTGAPAFAGFGFGPINLSDELGVTAGNFTEADFDNLVLSFDYMVSEGLVLNSTRLDAAGFSTRLEFPAELTSTTWETVTFSIADSADFLTNFVAALNGDAEGDATFQLSLSQGADGVFEVGDQAKVDNFSLSFAAVPEPSSALIAMFAMSLIGVRRSRIS